MSEYADITVKSLSLFWFRNYVNSDVVSLFFSRRDLIITHNCRIDSDDEDSGQYTQYQYKSTVKKVKERLDARGFGIPNLEKKFNENPLQVIDYAPFLSHLDIDYDEREKTAKERIEKRVSFKKWKNAMHKIVSYELENGNINGYHSDPQVNISTECDKIIYYSLVNSESGSFYGTATEFVHIAYVFRLILESCNDNDDVILDFSNLQHWDEDCIPKALSATEDVEKTIVLVEGTSDKDILEFAMEKIYPHLVDMFYFMDFDDTSGAKRDAGTSYIVKNLKTFYFSRLKAKFIAVFDNDAEGYASKCTLINEIKHWPDNFRILLYPEIVAFNKYPTLAPNGTIVKDNINKKACSIELYLPNKIIKTNGEYLPVEWEARKKIKEINGCEKALYQGVISQKNEIKQRFHDLRKEIESGREAFVLEDWERMKMLLDTIVFAFVSE